MQRLITYLCITISILLLYTTVVYAIEEETRIKAGYNTVMCEPITPGPVLSLSYQARHKWFAVEPSLTLTANRISQVGRMYVAEPSVTLKAYINNLYLGVGVGYYFNCVSEYFGNQSDLDDEINRFGVIGIEFPDVFIELKTCFSDIDLETGLPFEPEIEKHSRYDNFQVLIGKKYRF